MSPELAKLYRRRREIQDRMARMRIRKEMKAEGKWTRALENDYQRSRKAARREIK